MTREERIQKLASAIQREIVSCPNEQTYDEGDCIWISGSSTDMSDLLMDHNVPEELQDEVVSRLQCPACGSPLAVWQEVGTKYSFETQHDATIEKAMRKHGKALFDFTPVP